MLKIPPSAARRVVYPMQELILRRPTFAFLREFEQNQFLSPADFEALQVRKLRRLLEVACAQSPWHRSRMAAAGLVPATIECIADLRQLPTMDKADAAAHRESIVWRDVPGGIFQYNTGGSSGQPLIFYFGRARQAADAASRMRARRWWGIQPGEPEAYLWGAPVELNKTDQIKTLRDRMLNQLLLNAFEMSPERMDGYLGALERFGPRSLFGYASSVALLAAHARARNRRVHLPALRVVFTTGEPLFDHQRELIADVFGVPVANEYGCRDVGFVAQDTPQGQMLQAGDGVLLEVLDSNGDPVGPGRVGEAVMTGLHSDAQPFIRYRTGDIVRMSAEADRAGRGLPVIAEVVGRQTDFLVRPDGAIVHALAGIYVLRAVEGVAEFKLIQHTVRDLEVLVVAGPRWQPRTAVGAIEAGLRRRLGSEVRVAVRVVDAIAPEASGKHRYVVSRVPLPGGLGQDLLREAETAPSPV